MILYKYHSSITVSDIEVRYQHYSTEVSEMQDKILRKLFLAFMEIHILHHAKKKPFYGSWMITELSNHGYEVSAGTLYPILHNLEKSELLVCEKITVEGKVRKYYSITPNGEKVLKLAKGKIKELKSEI